MIRTGSTVTWRWGAHTASGKVVERFDRRVVRTIAGSRITKRGSPDDPAYLIEQDDGSTVLKLRSELR